TAGARVSVHNPDPSQGDRVYLDQIFQCDTTCTAGDVFKSIINALQVDFTTDLTFHLEADLKILGISITIFSYDFDLGTVADVHIPLATTQTKRALPLNLVDKDLKDDPNVTFSGGVLTLDASTGSNKMNPNSVLLSGKDGTVDASWLGHGQHHYTG